MAVDAGAGRIELETKYPVLEGAAGKSLSFEIKAKNNSDKVVVDFVTVTPSGWNAYVTPDGKRINELIR